MVYHYMLGTISIHGIPLDVKCYIFIVYHYMLGTISCHDFRCALPVELVNYSTEVLQTFTSGMKVELPSDQSEILLIYCVCNSDDHKSTIPLLLKKHQIIRLRCPILYNLLLENA